MPKPTKPKWNPKAQQFDWPPTSQQKTALLDLCAQLHLSYLNECSDSKREMSEKIDGLIKLRKSRQRCAKRARKRAERLRLLNQTLEPTP